MLAADALNLTVFALEAASTSTPTIGPRRLVRRWAEDGPEV